MLKRSRWFFFILFLCLPRTAPLPGRQIVQFEKDPKKMDLTAPAEPPDGPPIGADDDWDLDWGN